MGPKETQVVDIAIESILDTLVNANTLAEIRAEGLVDHAFIDTPYGLDLVKVWDKLGEDILALPENHPLWQDYNAHVLKGGYHSLKAEFVLQNAMPSDKEVADDENIEFQIGSVKNYKIWDFAED